MSASKDGLILCYDCAGVLFPDHYMVKDEVWLEAWPDYKTTRALRGGAPLNLCLTCLEKRLGRDLRISDFPPHLPINRVIYFAFALGVEAATKLVEERLGSRTKR